MLRWLCALVVAGVLSGFAFLLIAAEYDDEGPVIVAVSRTHGLHIGDVLVLAGWVVAMLALLVVVLGPWRAVPERR